MSLRAPAVAGQFYPGSKKALLVELERCIPTGLRTEKALGLMAPHAGYVYSGATAGKTFARVAVPDRVVVLAPNHTGMGNPVAVWSSGAWDTPLGPVAVDAELAGALLKACPAAADDQVAHIREHSLEVELPFIQKMNPAARILPVCLGTHSGKALRELGEALSSVIRASGSEALIVASSDMTHYETAAAAGVKDRKALERVLALDPEGLLDVVNREGITMCGAAPAAAMLWATKALGARSAELVEYTHSGAVSGDDSQVVGYAGVVVR